MTTLITILSVFIGIIALLLFVAYFTRKAYNVNREAIINAPLQKVFNYVRLLKNQDTYNKWVMADPNMKKNFKGIDGTVGFTYGWNGNKKAGEGEQEITNIIEGKLVESEIRFVRPFVSIAHATMTVDTHYEDQTRISWSNTSEMKYPLNIMVSMIEKMLEKDMDESLSMLKNILEK